MSKDPAFSALTLPERAGKPRSRGLTMMIDWGIPPGHQADIIAASADYIDMAKIAAAISGLMPREIVKQKLEAYAAANISTSPGGLFSEYAYMKNELDPFFQEVSDLGFTAVEISDNLLNWTLEEKRAVIRRAIDDYDLNVLGEVGRKDTVMSSDDVLRDIETCFAAGASAVYIEAYELFAGEKIREPLVAAITENFGDHKVIYELPVDVLPEINRAFKHKVCAWMVREFGCDVNLANVEWYEVYMTEMLRRRLADNLPVDGGA